MEPPRPNIQNYGIKRKQQDLTFKIQKNGRVRKTVNGTDPPWALERGDGSSIIKWTAECAGVHFQGSGGCRRTYTATTMRWGRIVVAVAATASVQQSSQDGCLNWSLGARGTGEGAEGVGGGGDYGHSAQCPLNISCLARPWCDPTLPCLWSNTASSAWCGQSVLPPAPPPPPQLWRSAALWTTPVCQTTTHNEQGFKSAPAAVQVSLGLSVTVSPGVVVLYGCDDWTNQHQETFRVLLLARIKFFSLYWAVLFILSSFSGLLRDSVSCHRIPDQTF